MSPNQSNDVTFVNEAEAPPIETKPRVKVHSWRLIRTSSGTLHLVTLRELRVERSAVCLTAAISAIDGSGRLVATSSGHEYELMGPPEEREFALDVLLSGAVEQGMGEAVDVSTFAWDLVQIN